MRRALAARALPAARRQGPHHLHLSLCRSIVDDALLVACGALADSKAPPARAGGFVRVL
jgi:hypothetical protein